jgi:ABC-type lipoprotein release transport system permease subunit
MFKSSSLVLKIAYGNLWRRRARTRMVILMIAVGISILTFLNGLYDGWVDQMIDDTLYSDTCQLTIYKKGYRLSDKLTDSIDNPAVVINVLQQEENVLAFFSRLKNEGMISSARYSQGVKIIGINMEQEQDISNIKKYLIAGEYSFRPGKKDIIIGAGLAEKLKVSLKKKVVIMGMAKDKSIASAAYRIIGIVRTNNNDIDKYAAFIPLQDSQRIFQMPNSVSQFSIVVKEQKQLDDTKASIQKKLGSDYEVFTWQELYRAFEFMQRMMAGYNMVFYSIIFIVVAIGIFNIVLISVLERVREFGIMLAVGTRFFHIARIIFWESVIIGMIGCAIGLVVGYLLLAYFHFFGLDLSRFASSMQAFGLAAIMYPKISMLYFVRAIIAVFITSFVAALWPIRILKKLNPVESIHFN